MATAEKIARHSTAPDEFRDRWSAEGPDGATRHLSARGYLLTRSWCWSPPAGLEPDADDRLAVGYLAYEWDYGGFDAPHEIRDGSIHYL